MSSRMGRTASTPLAGGVGQLPVLVPLAGEDRARAPAAHRDDDVGVLHRLRGEDLRGLGADVYALFEHYLHRDRVHLVCRLGADGADLDPAAGEVRQVGGGHLGPAGFVDADEQDGGLVGHERTFGSAASTAVIEG
jgi:hypothetical protein